MVVTIWRIVSLLWLMFALPVCANDWPLWQAFGNSFIQADGRVLADESEQRYSTSEGQAYALFFTLVANDRAAFDRILVWTRDNLAGGDLSARLPAWQWGKKPDGAWGVLDQNSASDADTWFAYTLLEAGRLWHEPRYTAQGNLMLANIRIHLIRDLPGAGPMLLSAASGFDLESKGSRLNPSYFPVQLLRVFSKADPSGPWRAVVENNLKMLQSVNVKGYVPDWIAYDSSHGYFPDAKYGAIGTHDAIRVYLWWGMLSRQDPMSGRIKKVISGMNQLIPKQETTPPLTVETQTGAVSGISPPSFSAALLPYFVSMGNSAALRLQRERLVAEQEPATGVLIGHELHYYDQVLALFGMGWMEHRFSFSPQGQLVVQWK
ncbi:MAG: cellulose synthase complex periplasmic endoglucanase BcsZ [Proteobacteria bacterium]|nr:cellulose synthase complex periplasmic endoglucanase BcsZ [Pseudomonadota bacterium]